MTYILLLICSAIVCGSHATNECWTEQWNQTVTFENCTLGEKSFVTCFVICQVATGEHWRQSREIDLNLTFRILDYDETSLLSVRRCISLSRSRITLNDNKGLHYATRFELPLPFLRLSSILTPESYLDVVFDKMQPVGFIDLIRRSIDNSRLGNMCVQRVEFNTQAIQWHPTSDALTLLLRNYSVSLGAQLLNMRLNFDPQLVSMSRLERVGEMLRLHEKTRDVWISHGDWVRVDGAAWNMSDLTQLVLSWNHIEHVDTGWLKPLKNVILLNLEHNNLKTVPNDIRFLLKLKYLDLSFNPITFPDIQLSWILHGFRGLNLSLASDTMSNLPGLLLRDEIAPPVLFSQLDLSFCNISLVPEDGDIFHHQYLLEVINLSYNALQFIPPTLVTGLDNLRLLDLSHNCLKYGPMLDISRSILHSMDLSWNMLETVEDIVQKGSVHKLNLSHNKINSWKNSYVLLRDGEHDPWVNYLDLSHNFISSFDNGMVEAISHLRTVDLGGNSFNCYDCSVKEFKVWLSETNSNSVVNLGVREPLHCSFPEGFHGSRYPIVTFHVPDDRCFIANNVTANTVLGIILAIAAVIIVFSVFVTVICYTSRYDVSYSVHLLAVKKKWNMLVSKSGRKYDVFISYSEEDRDWVMSKLAKGMESPPYNLKVSLRHRDLTLGSPIVEGAVKLIYNSRNTVVVLSHNYIDSQWCRAEMEHIRKAGHNMVLLETEQLERWRLSPEIRYLMDTRIYLPWQEGEDKPWVRVADALTGKGVRGK